MPDLPRAGCARRRRAFAATAISSGGTPDLWQAGEVTPATEYRPGTYIYLDRDQLRRGVGTPVDCALTVLSTVVSRPTADRAILDAGSKALSSDTGASPTSARWSASRGRRLTGLSEEHGWVTLPADQALAVGDRVRVLPNHACVVSNLFDVVHLISGETVVDVLPVAARGRMA